MDKIWEMSGYIKEKEINAYFADDSKDFPAVFRLDRISAIKTTERHFTIPYANRFKAGEFRKRVQFMYSGKLKKSPLNFPGDPWRLFWTGFQRLG
ncbi:MAG: hypothetical protein U9N62_06260 [Thermotogota bacterium]|nr:hypothetical protein [Thermotogota bacterium]